MLSADAESASTDDKGAVILYRSQRQMQIRSGLGKSLRICESKTAQIEEKTASATSRLKIYPDGPGMGVASQRVSQPGDIEAAIKVALAADAPYLLEVITEGRVPTP
jgi:hypothetical protein